MARSITNALALIVGLVAASASAASTSSLARSAAGWRSTPWLRGSPLGANITGRTPTIGANNFPIFVQSQYDCDLTFAVSGCKTTISGETDQLRSLQCVTDGAPAAMAAMADGKLVAPAQTGVLTSLTFGGVPDPVVYGTPAGFRATSQGMVYGTHMTCRASMVQKPEATVVEPAPKPAGKGSAAPRAETTPRLGIEYKDTEPVFLGGGTRKAMIAIHAKDQVEPFYFSTPLIPPSVDTSVVITNFAVSSGDCSPMGGQPFALPTVVYADRCAIPCDPVGTSLCGALLCSIPSGTKELMIEYEPVSLGSSDPLEAGLSIKPAE